MDRNEIVDLIKRFYINNIDPIQFLIVYAKHRGKTDIQTYEIFLKTAMFTGKISDLLEYAVDWYRGEYSIYTIWKINKENNQKIFITAY